MKPEKTIDLQDWVVIDDQELVFADELKRRGTITRPPEKQTGPVSP